MMAVFDGLDHCVQLIDDEQIYESRNRQDKAKANQIVCPDSIAAEETRLDQFDALFAPRLLIDEVIDVDLILDRVKEARRSSRQRRATSSQAVDAPSHARRKTQPTK